MVGGGGARASLGASLDVPADARIHDPAKAKSLGLLPNLCEYIYQFLDMPSVDKASTKLLVEFVEISLDGGKVPISLHGLPPAHTQPCSSLFAGKASRFTC
jgi:hypothetical protein